MTRLARLALVVSLCATDVHAQTASAGARFESYGISRSSDLRLRSLRLYTLPFGGRVPLGSGAELTVGGAYAAGSATLANGERGTIRGLIDTRVSIEARPGSLVLSASALLPTGNVIANESEATVVGLLSTELLPFGVTQWGTGGGVAGDLGVVRRVGETAVQLSLGGSLFRGSRPLDATLVYSPGLQLRARAAVESAVGQAGVLSMLLGYQRFRADSYGSTSVFTPGARLEAVVSYAFPLGRRESVLTHGGFYRLQGGISELGEPKLAAFGAVFPGLADRPARTLITAGGELRIARGRYVFAPRGDVRVLRRADGIGQGWLVSIGGRAEARPAVEILGSTWVAAPSLAIRAGRLVAAQGLTSGIFGGEVGVTLRWEAR